MFLGWLYDVAREQSPREALLAQWLAAARDSGYEAVGLYLEHRFEYASAPWAAAPGALTPETIRRLRSGPAARGPRIIPFLNTLGHVEGFVRSSGGEWLAEGPPTTMLSQQLCPSREACTAFCEGLIRDALAAFDDEWLHLGGDESKQLGQCPQCAARAARIGPQGIYAEHFERLCRLVLGAGRRPCLWADMLLEHPTALDAIPRQTLLFDWQYEQRPRETTQRLRAAGFDVVCCPSLQTYNSGWCFLRQSQENIDQHAEDARALGAAGVMLCTWEFSGLSQLESVLPLVFAAGRRLSRGDDWRSAIEHSGGPGYASAAELLGNAVPDASAFLAHGGWRRLRDRFVLRLDPFALWRAWRTEACSQVGDQVLRICDQAERALEPANPLGCAITLHRSAVRCVRTIEAAAAAYAAGSLSECAARLADASACIETLRADAQAAATRGGSSADEARIDRMLQKIERVVQRLRQLDGGAWRPAFETLTHDSYVPGDQAAWRTKE